MGTVQYLSAEGLEKLEQELIQLKTVARREVAGRIETAKALGDLSENAEYHEAKDALAFIEGRILEIEEILKNAVVIQENTGRKDIVRVGSVVEVEVNDKTKIFTIVGSNEAEPAIGKISNESPIGNALLGAKIGAEVEVKTPAGMITQYRIIAIQ